MLSILQENDHLNNTNKMFKDKIKKGEIPLYQAVEEFRKLLKSKIVDK